MTTDVIFYSYCENHHDKAESMQGIQHTHCEKCLLKTLLCLTCLSTHLPSSP